ncbi:MAG: molybdopterin-dependent oxidoreductase, partial [Pseudomonadota bacterium]
AAFQEPMKRVWGYDYPNQVTGCYMANPSATFRAMAGQGPYPVKAFFFLGNNPMMSYANMPMIIDGMMNQDLIVAHEHFMTPSAQLADYVLPGDSWLERPWLTDGFGWMSTYRPSEQAMEPPGEAKSTFEFWKHIAAALDRADPDDPCGCAATTIRHPPHPVGCPAAPTGCLSGSRDNSTPGCSSPA